MEEPKQEVKEEDIKNEIEAEIIRLSINEGYFRFQLLEVLNQINENLKNKEVK